MDPQTRRRTDSKDPGFEAYMRDVSRHPLLTAEGERELALRLLDLRRAYWRSILSYPPFVDAALDVIVSGLDDASALAERIGAVRDAGHAIRRTNRKAAAVAFEGAVAALAEGLADVDPECVGADRIAADLDQLAAGEGRGLSMDVRPPRRGSRPFAEVVARVRRTAAALQNERNAFARANLRLVVRIAGRFHRAGLSMHDRVQEGNIGLMKAVDRFDPLRGFRFSTYATWWIKHTIRRAVVNRGRTVRVPAHLQATAGKLSRARSALSLRLHRDPTLEELATELELPLDKVEAVERVMMQTPVSLEAPVSMVDDRSISDVLSDPDVRPIDDTVIADEAGARVRGRLLRLSPMEQDILRQRFGLDGTEPRTLAEIGSQYSLSRERIRQLQHKALRHLRKQLEAPAGEPRSALAI